MKGEERPGSQSPLSVSISMIMDTMRNPFGYDAEANEAQGAKRIRKME